MMRASWLVLCLAACNDGASTTATGSDAGAGDAAAGAGDASTCAVPASQAPSYANVDLQGGAGAFIDLYVTNVDPAKGDVSVDFTGAPAIVKGLSADKEILTIVVPTDALSGPLTLSVGCARYVGPEPFLVDEVPAPVVTAVTPATVARGDVFEITGTYFTGVNGLSVGGGGGFAYRIIDDSTLRVLSLSDAQSGKITVSSPSGRARSDLMLTVTP